MNVEIEIESQLKPSCCISTFVVKVNHSKMSSSTLIEVFGHIVYSFTRGVTEHYNPEEPEFTAESFGYDPLESTGREWYYHPVISPISADRGEEKACPSNFSIV